MILAFPGYQHINGIAGKSFSESMRTVITMPSIVVSARA